MWKKLFKPIDIAPLIYFRVFAGALITIEIAGEFFFKSYRKNYIDTEIHFSYYFFQWLEPISETTFVYTPWFFQWLEPISESMVYIHMWFNILMGLLVTLGLFYRFTTVLLFLGITSLFLMEKAVYINHTYLYCLFSFLLIFMPANRAWSLDVKRSPSIESSTTPAWTFYLLIFQMSVVYFFAGVAKLNPDWLQTQPMAEWLLPKKDYYIIGPIIGSEIWPYLVCYGGVIFDLFIVPAMLWKKTRLYAFIIACCFHFVNVCTFGIGTFPWLSAVVTALFFGPEAFRKLKFLDKRLPVFDPSNYKYPTGIKKSALQVFIVTYVVIQLAVPNRQWFYPGNTSWTENGHNFAWHMMLRQKLGDIVYTVKDPESGQEWTENPYKRMTRKQWSRMRGKPEMILEYAHYLVEVYRKKGFPNVEVYADATIRLNARKPQKMIDTTVNLAKEERSLFSYDWVLPLEDGPIIYKPKKK